MVLVERRNLPGTTINITKEQRTEAGAWCIWLQNVWLYFSTAWMNKEGRIERWRLGRCGGGICKRKHQIHHITGGLHKRWHIYTNTTWNQLIWPLEEGTKLLVDTKKHIYESIHTSMRQIAGEQELRVTKMWPNTNWSRVWDNLNETPVSDSTRIIWYQIIHDIIRTNERLQRIRMVQTDTCRKCTMKDTLEHRLSACGEGHKI